VSSLSDQVEGRIARANRVSRRSRTIIFAAIDELERHQRWFDRHRAVWAQDVSRQHRLLSRKLVIGAFTRFTVEPILFVPVALARVLRLMVRGKLPTSSPFSLAETAIDPTRHSQLPTRIHGLDGRLCTMEPALARPTPRQIEPRGACPSIPKGVAFRAIASLGSSCGVAILVIGVFALGLTAVGAVRAMLSSRPDEAPGFAVPARSLQAAAAPVASSKVAVKTPRSASASGFTVLAAPSPSQPLQLPPQTIGNMVLITSPLAQIMTEPDKASVAEEPLAAEPRMKPKPKRKVARHGPDQQLPWWQQLPWIRIR